MATLFLSDSGMDGSEDRQGDGLAERQVERQTDRYADRQVLTPVGNQRFTQTDVLHHTRDLLSRPADTQTSTSVVVLINLDHLDHLDHLDLDQLDLSELKLAGPAPPGGGGGLTWACTPGGSGSGSTNPRLPARR